MAKFRGPDNTWQKEKEKLKLDCFWECGDLREKRFIFEGYESNRSLEDLEAMTEKESKTEEYLDKWWSNLELGNRCKRKGEGKRFIYWAMMDPLSKEEKAPILESMRECLAKKVALLGEA
ncbi:hypothetical protein ES705_21171 [subsurface metagenome]